MLKLVVKKGPLSGSRMSHSGQNLDHAALSLLRAAIQDVATFCSVLRNKVKMISGDAEGTRVARGPEADERAFDVLEVKLRLRFCRVQ